MNYIEECAHFYKLFSLYPSHPCLDYACEEYIEVYCLFIVFYCVPFPYCDILISLLAGYLGCKTINTQEQ